MTPRRSGPATRRASGRSGPATRRWSRCFVRPAPGADVASKAAPARPDDAGAATWSPRGLAHAQLGLEDLPGRALRQLRHDRDQARALEWRESLTAVSEQIARLRAGGRVQ